MFIAGGLLVSLLLLDSRSGAAPNNDSLSLYLKLDETTAGTAADHSGDGNSGTVTGAAASIDTAPTDFTSVRSLSFDGDDYIEVADAPELSAGSITISAWVKFNSLSGIQTIAGKWDVSHWQEYVLQVQDDDLYFYTGDGGNGTSDSISLPDSLSAGVWYHVAGVISGTDRTVYLTEAGGSTISDSDTAGAAMSGSDVALTVGGKQDNGGAYFEFLNGLVDDVRVYSRALSAGELADLAEGSHTSAEWTGGVDTDYETAGNWDTGAVPDPYTLVTIGSGANQPQASANVALAGLSIDNGARLSLNGWNLTINDGGVFSNSGTLQLKNSETLSGFSNDTDSGTILLTPDADGTGLKTGNSYNDLIINDSTFAHWLLDETAGPAADVSGFERTAAYQGSPAPSSDAAPVEYANARSLEFNGSSDYAQFAATDLPANATWCAWIKMDSGDGAVLGSAGGQYALAVIGGNEVRVKNADDASEATWSISSIYGSWHHLCVTQTTTVTASLELYLDGSSAGSEILADGAGEIDTIGRGGSYYFDGLIDDVRIYNRALSPTEIDRLSNGLEPGLYVSTLALDANLDVNGSLTMASGRLDVSTGNYDINLGGNLRQDGGVFVARSGTVVLDGADQSINSSLTFYNLTKQTASAATLTFGKDSTTTITNHLTLEGVSGEVLSLRSSTPGTQWNIDPSGSETVSWLDIQDSNNIDEEPIDITGANVTDSGNNENWTVNVAPDDPFNLGPTEFTDGSFTTDTDPTLAFELDDANPIDTLRFRIQLATDEEFDDLVIDYTSELDDQGARSFTPGQGNDEDYAVGEEDMLLESGDYYWRVMAIDDYSPPNQSGWAVAADGDVAFRVDVSGPSAPGTPATVSSSTQKRPNWTWTESLDDGIGLDDPIYTLQWSTDVNFGSVAGASMTNNLSYTHTSDLTDGQWYFRVRATDQLDNHSTWSVSAVHLIDTTGPGTPVAPFTGSPTSITTPTWSWAVSTDAGIGLHSTQPYILNWSLTSNFSGTVYNTTTGTNSFTHSSGLSDGTWYMRVRAQDALGNLSSWSANGTVLIDGSPPSLPGQASTANPTNDSTPTWNWDASIDTGAGLHATHPYTVQWSANPGFSPVSGSTTSPTNSYTHSTPLADGVWYIRISARDLLNNQSGYSVAGQTTIDTGEPDAPSTPSTATPTNDNTPQWTWIEPDDNVGGVGLHDTEPYEVEWSLDEDFENVEDSAVLDATAFTHQDELEDGVWYFRVRAKDKAGNFSEWSISGEVHIDTVDPSVPGSPTTADPVNNNTPEWTWDAAEDEENGSGLHDTDPYLLEWSEDETFDEGSDIFSTTVDDTGFTHTDPLADGTWYFRVRAQDNAGNLSGWSDPAGSKVVDVGPPTDPGTPVTTSPSADNTPTWTWEESTDEGVGMDPDDPYIVEWSQDEDFTIGFVGSDTEDAAEFTHTDPLADGTWYFRVRAVDAVGNLSNYSEPIGSVFIDTTEPTTPGAPSTTTPTTDDTPAWSWAASNDGSGTGLAANGYIVEWTTDSGFNSVDFSSTSTTNSFTHTDPLADGTWYFRVRAVDAVGNESSNSDAASVEVDDTPPSVPGVPSTDTPTNNTTPKWEWSASTDNGVGLRDPVYDLEWSQDEEFDSGNTVFSAQTNEDELEFTHTDPLADGTWYFRVRAVDNLDNSSAWSTTGSVLISTTGPTKPGLPSAGSSSTTDSTPVWTWAASVSPAGLADPAYTVEWSQDEDFLIGVDSDPVDSNSFPHQDELADGVWYFRVIAEDTTGLFSPYSDTGSIEVDTTGPTAPGVPDTTDPTADTTPAWTWDVSDDVGVGLHDTEPYLIEWSEEEDFDPIAASGTSDTAGFTHTDPLADGTWYLRVRAQDKLGNLSAWSDSEVEIDATDPTTPGTLATDTPTDDTTPFWTWDASSDDGVGLRNPAYDVEWSTDSGFSGALSATSNNANFTHTDPLADGTWYFRVRAVDDVGNTSAWADGQVVVDNSVPTVPGTPSAGGASTNDVTPQWNWAASTDSGVGLGSPAYQVEWWSDEDGECEADTPDGNDTAAGASFTHGSDLSGGYWCLRVRAVDAVGNQSGWSGAGLVFVDTDLPTAPGTPSTASPTSDRTPAWQWDESTDEGFGFGDEPYELEWSQSAAFDDGVQSGTAAEEEFTHSTPLADGTWYFRVRAVDDASNQSGWSSAGSVVIDATAPDVPAGLSTDTPTKNTTPTWTWDASSDSGVGLKDPAYELAWSSTSDFSAGVDTATTDDPTFTHSAQLGFGVWYFRVRALDQLDNASAWATASISIDNTPPAFSALNSIAGSSSAIISWQTNEPASTKVQYGVGGQFSETTPETNTSPRVTSHSVTLSGLPACTRVEYRAASEDSLENVGTSPAGSFTTTACSGNAAVMGQASAFITGGSGGALSLNSGSAALTLNVPANFAGSDADFQAKQLSPAAALSPIGQPSGRSLVGSHIYDLKAMSSPTVAVSTFQNAVVVRISYTAAEAAGFEQSTLAIYRHDGTAWSVLSACNVNQAARVVTCQTGSFSVFGLFGARAVPAEPLPEGDGIIEPEPPEIAKPAEPQEDGHTETASDERGLSAAWTRFTRSITKRPVWWVSASLLLISAAILFILKKRRNKDGKHVPYGVHKDD